MKRALLFLLGLSLCANGWLLWRSSQRRSVAVVPPPGAAVGATEKSPAGALPVAALATAEPAALLDLLRATGADEASVRAMFEGVLRRRLAEKISASRIERMRTHWWRLETPQQAGEDALTKQMVTDPLAQLLGPDPLEVEAVGSKYAFLSPERQRQLAQIDLDYADIVRTAGIGATSAQTRAEATEQRLVAEERRKDLYAGLSPEERAEYDLRFSGLASAIGPRVTVMDITEAEYRKIKPLLDGFEAGLRGLPRDGNYTEAQRAFYESAMAQLASAIGYDRAADFVWSGYNTTYGALVQVARSGQLARDTPRHVMDLVADTGRRASEVHAQSSLTLGQKRAALVTLQQEAQAKLDRLVPVELQKGLSPNDLNWLKLLGEGSYLVPISSFSSSSGSMIPSLENSAPAVPGFIPLPARPPAK